MKTMQECDVIAPDRERESDDHRQREGFAFTDGDIKLLRLIYEHRFLRREQLSMLSGRPMKRLQRRLKKLVDQEYIKVHKLALQKYIYYLPKKALYLLVAQGITSEELLKKRQRTYELNELFLKHEMMIVDIHVALGLASRTSPLTLTSWREGRELFDKVPVSDHDGVKELPIRPDAFFSLEDERRPDGKKLFNFFLEADRSSMNHNQFGDKLRAYWHYTQQGLHTQKYNVRHVRIVTLGLTPERAQNLSALATALLPERAQKYFLFGVQADFSANNPTACHESILWCPRDHERVPLVSAPENPSPA